MRKKKICITGGAGFIGSHLIKHFVNYENYDVYNIDKLTYAGNLNNLKQVEKKSNYHFNKIDICNRYDLFKFFQEFKFDSVIHLAAESHVDRSIKDPTTFVQTNVLGTLNLLDVCREIWEKDYSNKKFYHISTDEVYGSLGSTGLFTEKTPYNPRSPYSASKASSDHFVRSYGETYGLPYIISNCSNNFGPFQYPEKLIPVIIYNILKRKSIPIYGDGKNIRDWLYVQDHVNAIDLIFHKGNLNETYNIGADNELTNLELAIQICEITDKKLKKDFDSKSLISFTKDRLGHDRRYAIDSSKLKNELKWKPLTPFKEGLSQTIEWYLKYYN